MPVERSSWSIQMASTAVKSGAEVTRMPASEEEISCSPAPIRMNGPAVCTAPRTSSDRALPRKPESAPRIWASATSTTAASAIRSHAIAPGDMSRSPILMNM